MQEHTFNTPRTARYFTIGSLEKAGEMWIVCHGYGQLASRFLERFRPIADDQRCVVAPEGLSRFYLSESAAERRVGASWMTKEDRLHEIDDYVRYLDALHDHVATGKDKVIALGFSQGSATACRWVVLGAARMGWRSTARSRPGRASGSGADAQCPAHSGVRQSRRVLHAENRCRDRGAATRSRDSLRVGALRGRPRN